MEAAELETLVLRLTPTWVQTRLSGTDRPGPPRSAGAADGELLLRVLAGGGSAVREVLSKPEYAAVRLLCLREWPSATTDLRPESERLLLAYGTLREGERTVGGAVVPSVRTVAREVRVPGRLYDLGAYPAAVVDHAATLTRRTPEASFAGDLVEVLGDDVPAALAAFDAYEQVSDATYRRVYVPTGHPEHRGAWVYDWVGPTAGARLLPSGTWAGRAGGDEPVVRPCGRGNPVTRTSRASTLP